MYVQVHVWDRLREKGPLYIVKFPVRARNVTLALKCMAN